jgi:hypothetical protein
MKVSGDAASVITIYLLYTIMLGVSVVMYVRALKPHIRGLIGVVISVVVTILFFVLRATWHGSAQMPVYLEGLPIGIILPVYYVFIKPYPSRFERIFMTICLVGFLVAIALSLVGIL